MFKILIKKILEICFKAIINELVIEYSSRKEVNYEATEVEKESIEKDVQRNG